MVFWYKNHFNLKKPYKNELTEREKENDRKISKGRIKVKLAISGISLFQL